MALQSDWLKIARELPDAPTLVTELLNFKVTIDAKTAHYSYAAWREGIHDDLVLAMALVCWFRDWWNVNLDRAQMEALAGVSIW